MIKNRPELFFRTVFVFMTVFVKNHKKIFIVLTFYIKFIPTFATNQYHF